MSSYDHFCPEGELRELERWNPLIARAMVREWGLTHYLRSWEYEGLSIEQCVHCGEMWMHTDGADEDD